MLDAPKDARTGIPSGEGLVANLVRFSLFLRSQDVSVSFSSLLDALHSLPLIDLSELDAFYHVLRCNLLCRKEDLDKFDELFREFWFHGAFPQEALSREEEDAGSQGESETTQQMEQLEVLAPEEEKPKDDSEAGEVRYSPQPLYQLKDLDGMRFARSDEFYEALRKLLHPLMTRMSRRYQYTVHGREIAMRRVLRKNMQYGGELILLDFKRKKRKKRKVVFLCDVSGSMDVHTLMMLQFVHALKRVDPRTEIFFFSTELTRVSRLFEARRFSSALSRFPEIVADWGGGTRIGHCLKRFNGIYGKKLLSSKTIVMIFSDGWDRGEIDILEEQMPYLQRRVHKVIWLNPLLSTRDYQPICRGMSAALPYVDYFLPAGSVLDLVSLEKTLEKMIA